MANIYSDAKNEAAIEQARLDGSFKVYMNGSVKNVVYKNTKTVAQVVMDYKDSPLNPIAVGKK